MAGGALAGLPGMAGRLRALPHRGRHRPADLVGRGDRVGVRRRRSDRHRGPPLAGHPAHCARQPATDRAGADHTAGKDTRLMRTADGLQHQAELASTRLPGHLPRLLPAGFVAGPASLAEHLARYGPLPSPGVNGGRREALIEEVGRAGLTGRGGAGFPTARKLAAVAAGRAPVVVANGTEGEPASSKDKVLLARSPHLVLDGAVLAAEMVGAGQIVIVVYSSVREIVDDAVAERKRGGCGQIRIKVTTAANRFVGGQASAVVHWIESGIPTPTATPPRLSERGLGAAPTLVQNVETLAHLGLIARYGASWFRSVGTRQEAGSMLVTILGAVREPCVQEIAIGTPIGAVLSLAGGPSAPLQALLLGGYFGQWVDAAAAVSLPFSSAGLAD